MGYEPSGCLIAFAGPTRKETTMTRFQKLLVLIFLAVWVWAAIRPSDRHDWLLENYLVFIFVPLIIVTGRYFKLSSLSYGLITLFMILHVIGSHYTYAEVPFGYVLQECSPIGPHNAEPLGFFVHCEDFCKSTGVSFA